MVKIISVFLQFLLLMFVDSGFCFTSSFNLTGRKKKKKKKKKGTVSDLDH